MSKIYHWHKNFTFKEIMNLFSYGTKNPETLTHNQKLTRLYRSTLRKIYATQLEGYKTDFTEFNKSLTRTSLEFEKMTKMDPESIELEKLFEKYEKYQEDNYDPSMVVEECRPYSSTSARYLIWSDDALKHDPFGYYARKLTSEKRPEENFPIFEDYPMNDTRWDIWEIFEPDFDDTQFEKVHAEKVVNAVVGRAGTNPEILSKYQAK